MNRPIKFRAWDKTSGGWVYFSLAELFAGVANGEEYDLVFQSISQFTGLLDKNGKEIYEGDVVKSSHTGNLFDVLFDDKAACFKILERGNGRKWMFGYDHKKWEVIGNVYENPELLT